MGPGRGRLGWPPESRGLPAIFRSGYQELIAKARRLAENVVLVTPTNVDEARKEHDYQNADIVRLTQIVRECGRTAGLPIVDVFGSMSPEDLLPDGLHPGDLGHQKLYHAAAPVIFGAPSLRGYQAR